jgi:AcrR family transcriptional regulator
MMLPIVDQEPPERADAQRNRDRILKAARALLRTRAIGEICMDELALRAGVGKGTLYRRFRDRRALCLALLDDAERRLQARLMRRPARDEPPLERLLGCVRAIALHVLAHADILLEISTLAPSGPERYMSPVRQSYRYEIHRLLSLRPSRMGDALDFIADAVLALLEPEFLVWQKKQLGQRRLEAWLATAVERLAG